MRMWSGHNRLQIFDNLRVVATLSVLFIHLSGWFLISEPSLDWPYLFLAQISRFAVPMFVFISAALFLLKYKDIKIAINNYYLSRLNKIVIPYFIVSVIYYIYRLSPYVSAKQKVPFNGWENLIDFLKHFLTIGVFSHLYFVPLIIMLYVALPILIKIYKKNRIVTLITLAIVNILFVYIMGNLEIARLFWRWTVFPYLVYASFGFLFADYYEKIKNINKKYLLLFLIVVLSSVIFIFRPYNSGSFGDLIFSSYIYDSLFGMFWILIFLLISFPKKINRVTSFLSQKSFGIYLFHYLYIDLIFSLISRKFIQFDLNILTYIILLISISILSIMSFWIITQIIDIIYKQRNAISKRSLV